MGMASTPSSKGTVRRRFLAAMHRAPPPTTEPIQFQVSEDTLSYFLRQ